MGEIKYFDNNATTRIAPEVVEAMMPFLTEYYGNPSSMHEFGGEVARAVNTAREQVAALVGAEYPEEIVFTSCGTESDNLAIAGTLDSFPEKCHFITTRVEHPAVLYFAKKLERKGLSVDYLGVDGEGMLSLDELREKTTENTCVVSIMAANNETGVLFPVEDAANIVHGKGAVFHTDAVQAAGKVPLNMKDSTVDLLSLSGHKIHAPKGVGALYVRRGTRLRPYVTGGHQERGRRGGTEAVPNIVALGKAAELALAQLEDENTRVRELRNKLEKALLENVPSSHVSGGRSPRLPNTASISFEFVEGEAILLLLSKADIAASSGSACTSGSLEPSHVLRAMGVPFTRVHGSIRFSLSRYNTEEEVDYAIRETIRIIRRLREISPFSETKPPASDESACSVS